jgi:hypothetical protein
MTDRRSTLGALDEIDPPDRWNQIARTPATDHLDFRGKGTHTAKRIGIIVVALAIGLAGTIGLFRAFGGGREPLSGGSAASALIVRCDGESVSVATPVVVAQSDGVHIQGSVTNLADPSIVVSSSGDPQAMYLSDSEGVDGEFVREVPPGNGRILCVSSPMTESEIANAPSATFTITDPDSVFLDYRLDCGDHIGIGGERQREEPQRKRRS